MAVGDPHPAGVEIHQHRRDRLALLEGIPPRVGVATDAGGMVRVVGEHRSEVVEGHPASRLDLLDQPLQSERAVGHDPETDVGAGEARGREVVRVQEEIVSASRMPRSATWYGTPGAPRSESETSAFVVNPIPLAFMPVLASSPASTTVTKSDRASC